VENGNDFPFDHARQLGNRPSLIWLETLMISCWSCGSCLCLLLFFPRSFPPVGLSQLLSWLFLWWRTIAGRF